MTQKICREISTINGSRFLCGETVSVLTGVAVGGFLDYKSPPGGIAVGDFVLVPLGKRRVVGVVWGQGLEEVEPAKMRQIHRTIDVPPLSREYMQFLERAAGYTLTSLNVMFGRATRVPDQSERAPTETRYSYTGSQPKRLTAARRKVLSFLETPQNREFTAREIAREAGVGVSVVKGLEKQGVLACRQVRIEDRIADFDLDRRGFELSQEQQNVADELKQRVHANKYSTTLLKGVAGSGKTEVYLEAVSETLRLEKQVLILLPEIALTAQFISRFEERFGARPLEWHSSVTLAEKRSVWRAVGNGSAKLVVGARSALYLPFVDLGIIVVDEEHDGSFKQDEGVIYNARDMAVLRASICNSVVVLSSATPSLETWVNARQGKYGRLDLTSRYGDAVMPEMDSIDMRGMELPRGQWISEALAQEVFSRLGKKEQTLLFLNRRGYAPLTVCRSCGHQLGCSDCDARMIEHRFQGGLLCHQCGARRTIPESCPECGGAGRLAPIGPGVERLAEEAARKFRDAKIEVLSSDLIGSAGRLRERIEFIASGGADIVIGTQLVAKGHNFPKLTLVGVIDADIGLYGSDIRAAEKTFQVIRQVAGRAGRAQLPGVALLQTWQPDHPVIQAILSGDDERFWSAEAEEREISGVPPFGQYVGIIVSGRDASAVEVAASELAMNADSLDRIGAELFGPAPAPIMRIRGRTRYRLLVKAERSLSVQRAIGQWMRSIRVPSSVRIAIDVDPQRFL